MTFDRKYLLCSLVFAVIGMCIGIYMAASQNHGEFIAHAHILLVGFVVSFVYGLIHKLWIAAEGATISTVQFFLHQAAVIVMGTGLLTWYGGVQPPVLENILAASSIGVLIAALLMVYMVFRYPKQGAAPTVAASRA